MKEVKHKDKKEIIDKKETQAKNKGGCCCSQMASLPCGTKPEAPKR